MTFLEKVPLLFAALFHCFLFSSATGFVQFEKKTNKLEKFWNFTNTHKNLEKSWKFAPCDTVSQELKITRRSFKIDMGKFIFIVTLNIRGNWIFAKCNCVSVFRLSTVVEMRQDIKNQKN